jgi:hypothetical protein
MDPAQAYAQANVQAGRVKEAADYISLDDVLMKQKARAAAYGDRDTAYKIEAFGEKAAQLGKVVDDYAKIPGGEEVVKYVAQLMFPGVDVSKMGVTDDGQYKVPLGGGKYSVRTPDGKWHITSLVDKPVDVVTQDASTFLTANGYDLTTPENQSKAFKWFSTPDAQAKYKAWVDSMSAARYNPPPVNNQFIGFTGAGTPATFNPRSGEVSGVVDGQLPMGKIAQPLTDKAQENLSTGLSAMNNLQKMDKLIDTEMGGVPIISRPINWVKGQASRFGVSSEGAEELTNLFDRVSADVQATIKGIPSNFDVQVFRRTLPSWGTDKGLAKKKVATAKKMLATEIRNQIAYYKGTNRVVPQEVNELAGQLSINAESINPNPQPWGDRAGGQQKGNNTLTRAEAMQYLKRAGGDKNKARELARKDGRAF